MAEIRSRTLNIDKLNRNYIFNPKQSVSHETLESIIVKTKSVSRGTK